MIFRAIVVSALTLTLAACSSGWRVNRVPPETPVDVHPRWNDVDAREVFHEMVDDCLSRPWVENWLAGGHSRPVMLVGTVRNETEDYIDTKLVTKRIEEEFVNSGRVRVVAERDQRGEIRDERFQGKEFNRPETIKAAAMELGADFMMVGRVADIKEWSANQRVLVNYYQFNLELIDIESNEKVWINTSEIKKVATR